MNRIALPITLFIFMIGPFKSQDSTSVNRIETSIKMQIEEDEESIDCKYNYSAVYSYADYPWKSDEILKGCQAGPSPLINLGEVYGYKCLIDYKVILHTGGNFEIKFRTFRECI